MATVSPTRDDSSISSTTSCCDIGIFGSLTWPSIGSKRLTSGSAPHRYLQNRFIKHAPPELMSVQAYVSLKHEGDKVIVFERAGLLFIFNCTSCPCRRLAEMLPRGSCSYPIVNATESFTDYRVGVDVPGEYKVILTSDEKKFGGHDRIALDGKYFTTAMEWNGRKNWLQVSLCRREEDAIDICRCTHLVGPYWCWDCSSVTNIWT